MNRIDRIRLSIFENENLTNYEKCLLLEATEDTQSANKVYIEAYKKTAFKYKKDIKEVKSLIKEERLKAAYTKLKETRKSLLQLETLVKNTPSNLSSSALSQLFSLLINTLISYALCVATEPVFKRINSKVEKELNKVKEKYPDKKINFKPMQTQSNSEKLKSSVVDAAATVGINAAYTSIKNHESIANNNVFKNMALKKINKEKKILDKLEKKFLGFIK